MLFKVREYRLKLVGTLLGPCRSTTKRVEVEQTDTHTELTTVSLRRIRRGLIIIQPLSRSGLSVAIPSPHLL